MSLRYDAGSNSFLQVGYSYGYTTRTFEDPLLTSRLYVFSHIQSGNILSTICFRNQINLSTGLQPLKNLWIRARLKLTSGLPYTPITGYIGVIPVNPVNLPEYTNQALYSEALFGNLNSARLPGYRSLDLSTSYDMDFSWAKLNIQGTLINVLNNKNVFYINNVTGEVVYQLPTVFNLSLGVGFELHA